MIPKAYVILPGGEGTTPRLGKAGDFVAFWVPDEEESEHGLK